MSSWSGLCTFYFITRDFSKTCLPGLRCNKIKNFYLFKYFYKPRSFSFKCYDNEECSDYYYKYVIDLISYKMKTILLLLFGSISTILCTVKGTNNILASLCKYFHCCCSDSLWPHRMQHTRLPCPSLSPGVCSKSRPLSRWCHPTILSSVVPFSSCL